MPGRSSRIKPDYADYADYADWLRVHEEQRRAKGQRRKRAAEREEEGEGQGGAGGGGHVAVKGEEEDESQEAFDPHERLNGQEDAEGAEKEARALRDREEVWRAAKNQGRVN